MKWEWAKRVSSFLDRLSRYMVIAACIVIGFIELALLIEIMTRRFLGSPQIWVQDSVGFGLFLIPFLVAYWLLKDEQHVSVDIVVEHISSKSRYALNFMTSILGVIMCAVIAWYSGEVVIDYLQRGMLASTDILVPKAPFIAIITLAMVMLVVQFVRRAYNFWVKWRAAE
jgi:C4-dicarboxylate transporter, DctQ subunit